MSFVKNQLAFPGAPIAVRNVHRFKLCAKCNESKPPEGGIEVSPTRWMCVACWTVKATRRET
jgi:hypothetical protein